MAFSLDSVEYALETHLETLSGLPDVFYINEHNETDCTIRHLRTYMLPASHRQVTLGDNGWWRHDGIYQIDVYSPVNEGNVPGNSLIEDIANLFHPPTTLTESGIKTTIQRVERGPSRTEDNFNITPISITWFAYVQNI